MKKILSMMGIALLMAGCTDDYTDWATPQSNAPEAAKSEVTLTLGGVPDIDMANAGETVQLFVPTVAVEDEATNSFTVDVYQQTYVPGKSDHVTLDATTDGYVAASDLISAVKSLYGARPDQRSLGLVVTCLTTVGSQTFKNVANTSAKVTLKAPHISDNYYVVGGTLDWAGSAASKQQKFSHSGADVYDDPVFTITIDAAAEGDTWFAIGDDEALDAITNNGDWSKLLGTTSGNGNSGSAGSLAPRSELDDDGSFCVANGSKKIRISINMMDQTYEVEPLSFSDFFYEIGGESGWSTSHALYGANGDGKYQGYYYLNDEFKFKPNADNWDDDLEYVDGTTMGGTLQSTGGPNCPNPGAGFYRIDLDAAGLTYSLTKIELVSIIGTANGNWDTDTDLTYNVEEGCWEVTTDLNEGEMKFRGNHNWDGDVDLGGSFDNLVHGGSNIAIEAGTYNIKLYISYAGQHHAVVTKL